MNTPETWEIDTSHSGINFSVRHMVIAKVRGQFSKWRGTILAPEGDLDRATVEVVIDAASITTGVADRDAHLKSPDFFDVARYPELKFTGRRVERLGPERLKLTGDLTIRDVTREVTLEVEHTGRTKDPWGHERAGFEARISINRKEFGLAWSQALETGGLVVGDRVDIELEVEAVK